MGAGCIEFYFIFLQFYQSVINFIDRLGMKQIQMQIRNRKPKRTSEGDKTLKGPRSRYRGHPIGPTRKN